MPSVLCRRFPENGEDRGVYRSQYLSVFTRNPRGSRAKALDPEDIRAFLEFAEEQDIRQILAHAPYTLNAASGDAHVREFARETMADDLRRMEFLPGNLYNFHPGSHVGQGTEEGIKNRGDSQ